MSTHNIVSFMKKLAKVSLIKYHQIRTLSLLLKVILINIKAEIMPLTAMSTTLTRAIRLPR